MEHEFTASHQQPKFENVIKNKSNLTLFIGLSNCRKTYLMNFIQLQKQKLIYRNTKSRNQYSNIKAKTSDEIQSLENSENSTVVFVNMLLSKRASNFDQFFLHEGVTIILNFTIYLKAISTCQKNKSRFISTKIIFSSKL